MIVVDLETSRDLSPERNGIWQIGVVDVNNSRDVFLEECRIAERDNVEEISLKVWKSFKRSKVVKIRNLICQSTLFDGFLWGRAKNGTGFTLPKETGEGCIKIGLPDITEFCGIERGLEIENGKVVKEEKSHNAPEDAKLEAECFSRLMYSKNFIEEFDIFGILYALRRG